jgi:hypothetical protein
MAHPLAVSSATVETLAGNRTITAAEVLASSVFTFDPGGAGRNVVLPNASATYAGQLLFIANAADAAEVLTIQADSATVCTPTQAESAVVWCDGTKWRGIAGANS